MQDVRFSFRLLRRCPAVWLPQLLAAIINLLVNTLAVALVRRLPELVLPWRRSVLGGVAWRAADSAYSIALAHSAAIAVYCTSFVIETGTVVVAMAATAWLVWRRIGPTAQGEPVLSLRSWLRGRRRRMVDATLLLVGIYMLDVLAQNLYPTAFEYVPSLNGAPAWVLIPLGAATDFSLLLLAYYVAIPFTVAVTLPPGGKALTRAQYDAARHWTVPFIVAWNVFQPLWGLVEAHFLPRNVDPGPVWQHPVTAGHPLFNYVLLVALSVMYATISQVRAPAADAAA